MSEARFTKGKWKARVDDGAVKTVLVYLDNKGGFDISGAPDPIANAHLIAAAPEMYATLNEARDFIASDINCGPCGLGLVVIIDELLAKARGE